MLWVSIFIKSITIDPGNEGVITKTANRSLQSCIWPLKSEDETLSCCCSLLFFARKNRQGGKHERNCQLTLPCSTDAASGHHHSESCQERWQGKSSSFTVKKGTQSSHRAECVVITQFRLASSRLACLLHSKRLCNLFKCEMTLFYWYWHVRGCSFGRFHCEDGAPSILPLFLFYSSLFLSQAQPHSTSSFPIRSIVSVLRIAFPNPLFMEELESMSLKQWNISMWFVPFFTQKPRNEIFFVCLLARFSTKTDGSNSKIISQNQQPTGIKLKQH